MDTTINVDIIDLADKKLKSEYKKNLAIVKKLTAENKKLAEKLQTALDQAAKYKDKMKSYNYTQKEKWDNWLNKMNSIKNIDKLLADVKIHSSGLRCAIYDLYNHESNLSSVKRELKRKKKAKK